MGDTCRPCPWVSCSKCGRQGLVVETTEWSQLEVVEDPEGYQVLRGPGAPEPVICCGPLGHYVSGEPQWVARLRDAWVPPWVR